MIHYNLQCDAGHGFDSWFKDSAAFEKQAKAGLVECPICGSEKVSKALMAPAIPKKGRPARNLVEALPAPAPAPEAVPAKVPAPGPMAPNQAAAGPVPAQVVALLQRMRAEVEKHCDYVGPGFAEEARRMHNGESAVRGIYGETTEAEAEALHEDGIAVARIPWVPRADG